MKNKKLLVAVIAVALVVALGVVGTLAWLLDEKEVNNTFTVGNVHLAFLQENSAAYNAVTGNYEFHIIPGSTYDLSPQVAVKGTSEAAYVRILITFTDAADVVAVLGADSDSDGVNDFFAPSQYISGGDWTNGTWNGGSDPNAGNWIGTTWDPADMQPAADNTITYEFRYHEVVAKSDVDTVLEYPFQTFTFPGTLTNEQLAAIADMQVKIVAQAIQAENLATADAAWAAFEAQAG